MEKYISDIVSQLQKIPKYEDVDTESLTDIVTDSMYLYLRLRRSNQTTFTGSELNWIKRASKEFLDKTLQGIPQGVTSYSESVFSLTFDSSTLSQSLLDEVVPLALVINIPNTNDAEDSVEEDTTEVDSNDS